MRRRQSRGDAATNPGSWAGWPAAALGDRMGSRLSLRGRCSPADSRQPPGPRDTLAIAAPAAPCWAATGTSTRLKPAVRTLLGLGEGAAPCSWGVTEAVGLCAEPGPLRGHSRASSQTSRESGTKRWKAVVSEDPAGEPGSRCV